MKIRIDKLILQEFEEGINTLQVERSVIPARILGYGEISSVFEIDGMPGLAYKRMPMFKTRGEAESYVATYLEYCEALSLAGIDQPPSETIILDQESVIILYIVQPSLPTHRFGHKLLHTMPDQKILEMIHEMAQLINRVWAFNQKNKPRLEIAVDGQISNWIWLEEGGEHRMVYIDTSTPLMRKDGKEQLDPELFLKSAPSFLRWLIRWLFLEEVMTHYYSPVKVFVDLAANLYKEQRPELIPAVIGILNDCLPDDQEKITENMVSHYYREDKWTWALFLTFRKIDRWLKLNILGKDYQYILPGKIKR